MKSATMTQIWWDGLIGVGKTTLCDELGKELGAEVLREPIDLPFMHELLQLFYANFEEYAWDLQMAFAMERIRLHELATSMSLAGRLVIGDRPLIGDRTFLRLHARAGNIAKHRVQIYERFVDWMLGRMAAPSAFIVLDCEPVIALQRIRERDRPSERGITLDYLEQHRAELYDLVADIKGGRHTYSRGVYVEVIPWNAPHQGVGVVIDRLRKAGVLPRV